MAAADILDVVTSSETTGTTSHTVDLPTDIAVGEWVIVIVASTFYGVDPGLPEGWARYDLAPINGGLGIPNHIGVLAVHECNGLEDWFGSPSPSIEITGESTSSTSIALRCSAGGVLVSVGEWTEDDTTPDPPAVQALWLDNESSVDVVAIAGIVGAGAEVGSISAYPSGYGDDQTFIEEELTGSGGHFTHVAIAADDVTATGDVNPGAFTLSSAPNNGVPFTILLFPAPDFLSWDLPDTGLIDVSVQIAVTDGLMVGYPVRWLDVTDQCREFSFQRGRQQQLDVIEAGTASLLLDNNDGDWTPSNTAGAYSPFVDLLLPVRIVARSNSVTYFLFTGYLERLPLVAPGRDDHLVQVTAVDALKVYGVQASLVRETLVEDLDPVAWWRMTGAATADSSSAATHTLTWNGSPFTGGEGVWPVDEAVSLDGSNDYATVASEADVELRADMTIEAWVRPTDDSGFESLFCCRGTDSLYDLVAFGGSFFIGPTDADDSFLGSLVAPVGEWAHVVATIDWSGSTRALTLWVNGHKGVGQTYAYQPGVATRAVEIGRRPTDADRLFTGQISELAVYDKVLTDSEILGLFAARRDPWPADQLTSTRISQTLDAIGFLPRAIRTGQTSMQAAEPTTDLREDINRAVTTEAGLFFVNGQGVAVFHDRHYRITQQGTAAATLTTTDGAGIHFADVVIGTDDTQLWTEVQVTPGTVDNTSTDPAVTVVARSDNIAKYGIRTLPLETFPNDRDDGLRMARHLLTRYETPQQRVDQVRFQVGYTQTEVTALLSAELGHRFVVARALPGDDFSEQVHLEAVQHSVSQAGWQCDWWLSPADTQTYWVLGRAGSSELGVTTRLAF